MLTGYLCCMLIRFCYYNYKEHVCAICTLSQLLYEDLACI